MPWIVLIIVAVNLVRAIRKRSAKRSRPLCANCSFVHMQYGVSGRNAIFCSFGGGLRPVQIDVLYCTDYTKRGQVTARNPMGFVPVQGIEPAA